MIKIPQPPYSHVTSRLKLAKHIVTKEKTSDLGIVKRPVTVGKIMLMFISSQFKFNLNGSNECCNCD